MSDIERGLKEAIAEAQAKGLKGAEYIESPGWTARKAANGEDKQPALTAPAVIEHILALAAQARAIEVLVFELTDELAGAGDSRAIEGSASNKADMSIFDRMGLGLLELTRTLESIERNVKRSLGAVKP